MSSSAATGASVASVGGPSPASGPWTTDLLGPLLWIDLETTGLDPETNAIAEVAMAMTTWEYTHRADLINRVVKLTTADTAKACDFVQKMHARNGLFKECLESKSAVSLSDLDTEICDTLDTSHPELCKVALGSGQTLRKWHPAGNSVHFDVSFIRKWLPKTYTRLDHRHLDVSSFGLKGKLWRTKHCPVQPSHGNHRAMTDVYNSIELMKWYEQTILRGPTVAVSAFASGLQ